MKTKPNPHSPAYTHVLHVWQHSTHASYQRLNGALYSALRNAVTSEMDFRPDDIMTIANATRGTYWMGDLEGLYGMACGEERGCANPSAVAALEAYFGRPAWLWAEKTKTPTRLCLGSKFHWLGEFVTVTSFNDEKKSLTACSYAEIDSSQKTEYFEGGYRRLEMLKRCEDDTICCRYSPKSKAHGSEPVKRRFTITHDELKAARKEFDDRRRKVEKEIAACTTLQELDAAAASAGEAGTTQNVYRHFDLDIIRASLAAKRAEIERKMSSAQYVQYESEREAETGSKLERWVAGEDVRAHFTTIRVRIKGNRVEVSNGNSVTLEAAKQALSFAVNHAPGWPRGQGYEPEFDVDGFKITCVHAVEGVTIGCTVFPWPEIKRFAKLMRANLLSAK